MVTMGEYRVLYCCWATDKISRPISPITLYCQRVHCKCILPPPTTVKLSADLPVLK